MTTTTPQTKEPQLCAADAEAVQKAQSARLRRRLLSSSPLLMTGNFLGLKWIIWVSAVVAIICGLILAHTKFGFLSLIRYGTTTVGGHGTDSLAVITDVVLGGTSLFGGIGGLFIPTALDNGFVVMNVEAFWQQVAIGLILSPLSTSISSNDADVAGSDEARFYLCRHAHPEDQVPPERGADVPSTKQSSRRHCRLGRVESRRL